jgi:hypothetical protein
MRKWKNKILSKEDLVCEGCAPLHTRPLPQKREKYILQACQKLKRKTTKKRNAKWRHCPSLSVILAESAGCLFSATISRACLVLSWRQETT